jgi:hypothetical protein
MPFDAVLGCGRAGRGRDPGPTRPHRSREPCRRATFEGDPSQLAQGCCEAVGADSRPAIVFRFADSVDAAHAPAAHPGAACHAPAVHDRGSVWTNASGSVYAAGANNCACVRYECGGHEQDRKCEGYILHRRLLRSLENTSTPELPGGPSAPRLAGAAWAENRTRAMQIRQKRRVPGKLARVERCRPSSTNDVNQHARHYSQQHDDDAQVQDDGLELVVGHVSGHAPGGQ